MVQLQSLHMYPLGQVHIMAPGCWCDPAFVIDEGKCIWVHRMMHVQEPSGKEDLGVVGDCIINHSETVH